MPRSLSMIAGQVARVPHVRLDSHPGAGTTRRARLIAGPLAVSLGVHALALMLLASLVSGGASTLAPGPAAPIRATLTTAAQKFLVPEPEVEPAPAARALGPLPGSQPALLPVPLKPPPTPAAVRSAPEGRVAVAALDASHAAGQAQEKLVNTLHPGAVRATPEFEVPPPSIYPKAALAQMRQLNITVAVVIDEEGRVGLLPGSHDDAMFTPSIKAALEQAKARPLEVGGRPRVSWGLLTFMFEYVGAP